MGRFMTITTTINLPEKPPKKIIVQGKPITRTDKLDDHVEQPQLTTLLSSRKLQHHIYEVGDQDIPQFGGKDKNRNELPQQQTQIPSTSINMNRVDESRSVIRLNCEHTQNDNKFTPPYTNSMLQEKGRVLTRKELIE